MGLVGYLDKVELTSRYGLGGLGGLGGTRV